MQARPSESRKRPRILVVDDEEPNRQLLDAMLVPEGYEVIEAVDGDQALQIIAQGDIDVILLDVRMPVMDGFDVCRRIRSDLGLRFVPVVFITAVTDRMARIQGKAAGADDFLSKPIDNLELLARVRNLLQVKAYHDLREKQKQAVEEELDRTRDQLLRSERLAILGTLAAGVGHELKNVAQMQVMAIEKIEDQIAKGALPPLRADIQILRLVRDHLILHAKHLQHLGSPGPDRVVPVDLRALTRVLVDMLKMAGRAKYTTITLDIGDAPVVTVANPVRLEQVFVNLLGNAIDALQDTGDRRNRSVAVRVYEDDARGLACCEIRDNGCGMTEATKARLFEPYLTTKEPGRGTGLGLVVVKTILESYRGMLSIESERGIGTTVTFALPRASPEALHT